MVSGDSVCLQHRELPPQRGGGERPAAAGQGEVRGAGSDDVSVSGCGLMSLALFRDVSCTGPGEGGGPAGKAWSESESAGEHISLTCGRQFWLRSDLTFLCDIQDVLAATSRAEEVTRNNSECTLNVALSYTSR